MDLRLEGALEFRFLFGIAFVFVCMSGVGDTLGVLWSF